MAARFESRRLADGSHEFSHGAKFLMQQLDIPSDDWARVLGVKPNSKISFRGPSGFSRVAKGVGLGLMAPAAIAGGGMALGALGAGGGGAAAGGAAARGGGGGGFLSGVGNTLKGMFTKEGGGMDWLKLGKLGLGAYSLYDQNKQRNSAEAFNQSQLDILQAFLKKGEQSIDERAPLRASSQSAMLKALADPGMIRSQVR